MSFKTAGSYKVADTEQLYYQSAGQIIPCVVWFLDDTKETFHIDSKSTGQVLIDQVFDCLELLERDYFGLQYFQLINSSDGVINTKRWLDPTKPIRKELKGQYPFTFYFRVKFYIQDPTQLVEEYTRYHFFLQCKKDILEGRLVLPLDTAALLSSYAVQSELGDYCPEEHKPGYVGEFRFIPNQTTQFEKEVAQLHQKRSGLNPSKTELEYLNTVRLLDHYGCVFYDASDSKAQPASLGVCATGIALFKESRRSHTYHWSNITKLSFKKKSFYIHVKGVHNSGNAGSCLEFSLSSSVQAKALWSCCIEYHTFFRMRAPPLPSSHQSSGLSKLFSARLTPTFSGRTLHQVLEAKRRSKTVDRSFVRTPSRRFARRTIQGYTPSPRVNSSTIERRSTSAQQFTDNRKQFYKNSTFRSSDNNIHNRRKASHDWNYATISTSTTRPINRVFSESSDSDLNDDEDGGFRSPQRKPIASLRGHMSSNQSSNNDIDNSPSRTLKRENSVQNGSQYRERGGFNYATVPVRRPSKPKEESSPEKANGINTKLPRDSSFDESRANQMPRTMRSSEIAALHSRPIGFAPELRSLLQQSASSPTNQMRLPNGNSRESFTNDSHQSFMSSSPAFSQNQSGASTCHLTSTTKSTSATSHPRINGSKLSSPLLSGASDINASSHSSVSNPDGLVTIRIKPDSKGRFGFNVKGGMDQGLPIIVSRVGPDMPADQCIPRLHEGDQVLFINGRDISSHTHEQVVHFIRSAAEKHSGELVLVVRPSIYVADENPLEPLDLRSLESAAPSSPSEQTPIAPTTPSQGATGDPLKDSVLALEETLTNGVAIAQFEKLYRRKPGLTMDVARLPENSAKNRYRDISPYDITRVLLREAESGDYINASYVNMEIARSGIVNRYIAAQGPLPHTCADFWQMCWEQQTSLVVMLTASAERGRAKCHQYWPNLYETSEYGDIQLTCLSEHFTPACAYRELMLYRTNTREERRVSHMQYTSWPDHGVPPDVPQFIDLVQKIRHSRAGQVEPVVVHCSAGIGRTGVVITMETAMNLIEANQPVYPLDLVVQMRDQRAMLIQTPVQYQFVCEAILRVYNDEIVSPLPEFAN